MAGNSLESLLAWMKDNSQMRGWDLIVALEGGKLNHGLETDYITRLSQGIDLSGMTGTVEIPDTNVAHYLSGFTLAAAALSFDRASFQSSRAYLRLTVAEGNHMAVETALGQKRVTSLRALDPLDGPQVTLDLIITTDAQGVRLDLANSEQVLLTLFGTPNEQREGGKLFKSWFQGLDADQRVYTLATFPNEGNPFMFADDIHVRTQAREEQPLTPGTEDGALLVFSRMVDGHSGSFPGDGSGFKYLIPDDDAQQTYSGTALFSQALIHRAAFGHALVNLLEDAEFERTFDQGGALVKMVATRGVLQAAVGRYASLDYEFESEAFNLSATGGASPLTVEFAQNEVRQRWQGTLSLSFSYRVLGGTAWSSHTATFNIDLQHEFRLLADESGASAMEGELFMPYTETQEVSHVSGLPVTIEPLLLEHIKDFVANTVKRAILGRFATTLTTTESETFLAGVGIVGSSLVQPSHVSLPFDLAMFGQINTSGSSFSIVERQPMVAAGRSLQLSTEPELAGLRWSVESIAGSGGDPGEIDERTGLYQAPPAHALNGAFNRVLVIASDPSSQQRSVTLLTVMAKPITVNPHIQVCYHDQQVELSAGHLDGSELSWAIKNPVAGESGDVVASDKPGGDHTYVAGPRVSTKTFVLDEVEVAHETQVQSTYVLVLQKEPGATIKPADSLKLPEGQIQLQVFVNDIPIEGQWSLPLGGPGSIDASTGLYSESITAKERFVLITVLVKNDDFGDFEGYIILPLPLTNFPSVLSALAN
ncbi:hypothetical protein [Pseudomonas sp. OA65]|uniref:hypothetical protein n=1 Tax=Pseudomonas sp. OA65 TaxID=2818431 RepID=UPI001A9F6C94|nr:hypothetical protein [Pseudomonas sp. OA65]MBO1542163.1 hypothetical protein [Pseudomonas sp. OA65]